MAWNRGKCTDSWFNSGSRVKKIRDITYFAKISGEMEVRDEDEGAGEAASGREPTRTGQREQRVGEPERGFPKVIGVCN